MIFQKNTGYIAQIFIATLILGGVIFFSFRFFQDTKEEVIIQDPEYNEKTFQETNTTNPVVIGIALGTNIATSRFDETNIPINLYKQAIEISHEILDSSEIHKYLIEENLEKIQSYISLLDIEVKELLNTSTDRSYMLEHIIEQHTYRYTKTLQDRAKLLSQLTSLQEQLTLYLKEETAIKSQISYTYKNFNALKTQENINSYLEVQDRISYIKTYIVFLEKFITTYDRLNALNKMRIDVMSNNKEALIKNATVKIPNSSSEIQVAKNLGIIE